VSRVANKTARLQEIEALLIDHPEGLTQTEIARRLGVNRSTISRNLRDLQAPVYEENGRLKLDRKGYLLHLRLSLHEALSLHMAARLLAASLDRQNAHAAIQVWSLPMRERGLKYQGLRSALRGAWARSPSEERPGRNCRPPSSRGARTKRSANGRRSPGQRTLPGD